jgi:transposase
MGQAEGTERRPRRFRSVAEKRRIVELTLEPGASVALVARAHGVNANQVFKWRRAFDRGELVEPATLPTALLPVTVSTPLAAAMQEPAAQQQPVTSRSIRIEFPGRAIISVESGADSVLLCSILESLRQ